MGYLGSMNRIFYIKYGSFYNLSLYQFQGPRNEEVLKSFDKKTEINFETVHNIGKYRLHGRFAHFSLSIGQLWEMFLRTNVKSKIVKS